MDCSSTAGLTEHHCPQKMKLTTDKNPACDLYYEVLCPTTRKRHFFRVKEKTRRGKLIYYYIHSVNERKSRILNCKEYTEKYISFLLCEPLFHSMRK